MAIKLNVRVFNELHQILNGSIFNTNEFKDIKAVVGYLRSVKSNESADWIERNNAKYLSGLLEGFKVDNSQEQALRDIHRGK